ncbi:MAG: 2-oxoacid:acceptor oxidoreductase family protein [Spirochaetes bacterium]|nr:2-oxoacid:acceptor oxidoreductase family protein [Spirochaetota bacterium]
MGNFIEIRWHGRGGQGAKSASQIIAESLFALGKFAQSFPEYGAERAGAPMRAFNRIDEKPITLYAPVENPDIVIVIDPTLLSAIDVSDGLKKDGILLINSKDDPKKIKTKFDFKDFKVYTVPASTIAVEEIGRDMPNTPMLGALSKISSIIKLKDLEEKFKEHFTEKLGELMVGKNIKAMARGFKEVKE